MVRVFRAIGSVAVVLIAGTAFALFLTGRLRIDPTGKFESKQQAEPKGEEHEETKSHVVDGKIVLDSESLAASGVKTAPAAIGSVAVALNVTGQVEIAADRMAHVTPRIGGTLRAVDRTLGDLVGAGDVLCNVESVELGEARAAHVSADSELTLTERNYKRWQELYEKGLRTQNELWAAENEFTRARIRHDAATNKLKALGVEEQEIAALDSRTLSNRYDVKSPIAGTVLERHATLGENVETKDVLFVVADLSEVWVQAAVYEKDLSVVHKGMAATLRTQAYPDSRYAGNVTYVGERVDEKTRTVSIRVTVKNGPPPGGDGSYRLRPGMFTTVNLEVRRADDVVVVPVSAVQTMGETSVCFVRVPIPANHDHEKKGDDKKGEHQHEGGGAAAFEKRVVRLGERDEDSVQILTGLKVGDEVVVENAFLLKSELDKSRIAEGD